MQGALGGAVELEDPLAPLAEHVGRRGQGRRGAGDGEDAGFGAGARALVGGGEDQEFPGLVRAAVVAQGRRDGAGGVAHPHEARRERDADRRGRAGDLAGRLPGRADLGLGDRARRSLTAVTTSRTSRRRRAFSVSEATRSVLAARWRSRAWSASAIRVAARSPISAIRPSFSRVIRTSPCNPVDRFREGAPGRVDAGALVGGAGEAAQVDEAAGGVRGQAGEALGMVGALLGTGAEILVAHRRGDRQRAVDRARQHRAGARPLRLGEEQPAGERDQGRDGDRETADQEDPMADPHPASPRAGGRLIRPVQALRQGGADDLPEAAPRAKPGWAGSVGAGPGRVLRERPGPVPPPDARASGRGFPGRGPPRRRRAGRGRGSRAGGAPPRGLRRGSRHRSEAWRRLPDPGSAGGRGGPDHPDRARPGQPAGR